MAGTLTATPLRRHAVGMRFVLVLLACVLGSCSCGPRDDLDAGPRPDGASLDAGSSDAGRTDAGMRDAGQRLDAGPIEPPLGTVSGALRVDHLGWRPSDPKVAMLLEMAGAEVEVRRSGDNGVAGTYTAGALATDEDSGDEVAELDFSALTTPGDYYLYVPASDVRSYVFRVSDDVYDIAGWAAMKSFYFQRCNHDHALPFASDRIGVYGGEGEWVDGACHTMDSNVPAGPDSTDHGALDLHGGWHDAGDYQKTLWNRGVPPMLFAYEVNPSAWPDGVLSIPESGNGVSDLLDELRWELDFYVRMQRPDGHFMTSVKGRGISPAEDRVASPPSASNEERFYFDTTSPEGGDWSGGGVTIEASTGNAVLALAHGAIVFRAAGQNSVADGYASAARAGWSWLSAQTLAGDEAHLAVAAAAAVHRMDPSISSASARVNAFAWSTWDGQQFSATPADGVLAMGAWHVLMNTASSEPTQVAVRTGVETVILAPAFEEDGAYGGMRGQMGNGWDYSWGSNRAQSMYGANVLMARHLGVTGGRSEDELLHRAIEHMHYMLGLNPLNMVYLTNMAAYGAEHSSFQAYHLWFSTTVSDGDNGNAMYNGLPSWVDEPLYPYYPDDDATSTYGPAPGIVVGGPNAYYTCSYTIPNEQYPAYAYRDFSVSCDWDGARCLACAWEITEPSNSYQGPFVLLASFLMSGS
jgi:endoglucanase